MQRAAGRAAPCRSVCHYGQTYKVWLGRSVYPNTGPNICPIKPMQPICPIKPIQPIKESMQSAQQDDLCCFLGQFSGRQS